jgi:hypothetical protein
MAGVNFSAAPGSHGPGRDFRIALCQRLPAWRWRPRLAIFSFVMRLFHAAHLLPSGAQDPFVISDTRCAKSGNAYHGILLSSRGASNPKRGSPFKTFSAAAGVADIRLRFCGTISFAEWNIP